MIWPHINPLSAHRQDLGLGLAALATVITFVILQGAGEATIDALRYQRAAVSHGQWWRLLTASLVHAGWPHLLLNAAGVALAAVLARNSLSAGGWLLAFTLSAATTSGGLWSFSPSIDWYLGASGSLHGILLCIGLLLILRRERLGWIVTAMVVLKLVWEQVSGPLPGSEEAAGVTVVTVAHLYGALGGLLSGVLLSARQGTTKGKQDA